MKKFIRIIALLMALLTVMGMAVACAETGGETTTEAEVAQTAAPDANSTEAEETDYALDKLRESYNFNETITFFISIVPALCPK